VIVALIPARAGSKGVPGKNVRPIAGHPLIAYSIAAARLARTIDRVLISTDSPAIAAIGEAYGAEVPFLRPAELASDASPDRDFLVHALAWLQAHGGEPEYIVHLRPTTPLRDPARIDEALDRLRQQPEATALRSAHEASESPFKWFRCDADGLFQPFRAPGAAIDYAQQRRQDVPPIYVPDGYVDIVRPAIVQTSADVYGPRMLSYISPACIEIDTEGDVAYVDYQLRTRGHPLLDALETCRGRAATASVSDGYRDPFSREPVAVPRVATPHRRIVTALPVPESLPTLETLARHEPRAMALDQVPVVWDRAAGYQVYDPYGNCWIDFTSGIFVANVGHGHPAVVAALRRLLDRPLLHNYYFPSDVRATLVRTLVAMSPPALDTAFLLTTGSEVVECAIKLMRIHGRRLAPEKTGIVSLTLGFHGKTLGSLQAGGRPAASRWVGVRDPNFHHLPVPDPVTCPWRTSDQHLCGADCFTRSIQALASSGVDARRVAGFLLEPYQGWSAAFLPDAYVRALRAWATEHDALVTFDEVQSGIGRTGRFLAHEYFGVDADLVCVGKGLSSSLPVSALLGRRTIVDVDPALNSTHGGNPLCCAAALATLQVIVEEDLVARAASLGEQFEAALRAIAARYPRHVSRVEGRGLVWSLHLIDPRMRELDIALADEVTERAMRKGVLLVRTGVGTIKIGPPLSIPIDAALEGLAAIDEAIADALHDAIGRGD
jgi:4-aminobutyrate aminotransferase / (S)-3-amino-2-methylpropionate transaminase / 5-aminovalerate transaminase